jgi:signal transduction histidine kinase
VSDPFGVGQVSLLIVRLLYLVSMVWVIYLTIDRLRSGDSDSRVLVVGLLILVLTGFHDILLAYGLVADGRPILHFGMLSLVASLTTIAGARIVRAFGAVERQAHAIRRMSEERLRMADELHDGLGSVMTNIGLLSDIGARRPERATASLATVSDLARRGLEEIRSFMRALDGHKPRWRDLLAEYRLFGQSTLENLGIQFVLRDSIEIPHETLPEHLYVILSRTFREVVTNAIKHSGADRIQVTLVAEGSKVRLEVRDNGTGRPGGNQLEGAYTGGHGLGALLRRVQNAGGELSIVRASGWIVSVNLPIEAGAQTIPDNGDSVRIDATR